MYGDQRFVGHMPGPLGMRQDRGHPAMSLCANLGNRTELQRMYDHA
jgi:hypothetical protein